MVAVPDNRCGVSLKFDMHVSENTGLSRRVEVGKLQT
jgi:hypothetical protein